MIDSRYPSPLSRLLNQDREAMAYYDSLRPGIRRHMEEYANDILSPEDLSRIADMLMSQNPSDDPEFSDDDPI